MILARDPLDELRRAFRLFDNEGRGKISLRDLRRVAKELGEGLGDDELYVASLPSFDSRFRRLSIDDYFSRQTSHD